MVVVEARHLCVEMRGVKKPGAVTVTSAIRGIFHQKGVREEFLDLVRGADLTAASRRSCCSLSRCRPHRSGRGPQGRPAQPDALARARRAGWSAPHARLATRAEEKALPGATDDAAATAFIDRFWAKRDPDPERPGNPVREQAEQRATEADRRFTEAGYAGRRTDRGTIFVLYGEPGEVTHEPGDFKGEPPVEVWTYPESAAAGVDGKRPEPRYRFVQQGDLTILLRAGRGPPTPPRDSPTPPSRKEALDAQAPGPVRRQRRRRAAARRRQCDPRARHRHQRRMGARAQRHRDAPLRGSGRRGLRPGRGGRTRGARRRRGRTRRGRLPGLRDDDAGPLLPRLRHARPADDRDAAAPRSRPAPAVRRLRLRAAGGRRAGRRGRRPHGAAGRLRRAHVADALFRDDLGGDRGARRGAGPARGLRRQQPPAPPGGVVRRRRGRDGLPRRRRRGRARHPRAALYGDGANKEILYVPGVGSGTAHS